MGEEYSALAQLCVCGEQWGEAGWGNNTQCFGTIVCVCVVSSVDDGKGTHVGGGGHFFILLLTGGGGDPCFREVQQGSSCTRTASSITSSGRACSVSCRRPFSLDTC